MRPRVQERNYYIAQAFKTTPYGVSIVTNKLQILDSLSISPWNSAAAAGIDDRSAGTLNGYQAAVSETAGIVTVTEPTLVASTTYAFTFTQYNPVTKEKQTQEISYTTPDVGTPPVGSVVTALALIINSLKIFNLASATASGAVLTITAATGYPLISLSNSIGGLTFAVSTSGVASLGTQWDMNNIGDTGATAGVLYDVIDFTYEVGTPEGETQKYLTRLYINQSGANYAGFKAALKALLTPAALGTVESITAIA